MSDAADANSGCGGVSAACGSLSEAAAAANGLTDVWENELDENGVVTDPVAASSLWWRRRTVSVTLGEHAVAARLWAGDRPATTRTTPNAAWALAAALRAERTTRTGDQAAHRVRAATPGRCTNMQIRPARRVAEQAAGARRPAAAAGPHEPGGAERDFATDFVLATAAAAVDQHESGGEALPGGGGRRSVDFALAHVVWGRVLNSEYRWDEAKEQARAALELSDQARRGAFRDGGGAHRSGREANEAEAAFRAALDITDG